MLKFFFIYYIYLDEFGHIIFIFRYILHYRFPTLVITDVNAHYTYITIGEHQRFFTKSVIRATKKVGNRCTTYTLIELQTNVYTRESRLD
jgi:hypothetical protein